MWVFTKAIIFFFYLFLFNCVTAGDFPCRKRNEVIIEATGQQSVIYYKSTHLVELALQHPQIHQ